jgi:hypothetical protein
MQRRTNRRMPVPPSALAPVARPRDRKPRRDQPPIVPNEFRHQTEVPDSVPAAVTAYSWGEDQLLLAKVRHNRLLDLAPGLVSHSLGSVRGIDVPGVGPVHVDELYVGLPDIGPPRIVSVFTQRSDRLIGALRLRQAKTFCYHHYPDLPLRFVAAQFKRDEDGEVVVLFELARLGDRVYLRDEKQYRIISASQVRRTN